MTSQASGPDGLPVRALSAALLCASSGALPTMMVGALVVQISGDLELSEGSFGLAISTFFLTSSLVSLRTGRIGDEVGWQRATWIAGFFSTLSLVMIAGVVTSLPSLMAAMAIGGVGQSIAMPTSNLAIIREVAVPRQGFAFGIKQTANPLASILAGISIPAVAVTVGWRWAFVLVLALPVAAAVLVRGQAGHRPTREARDAVRRRAAAFERRPLVLLAIGGGLAGLSVTSLSAFVVASAVTAGVDVARAGIYLAIASVTGLLMRVLSGWLADHQSSLGLRPVAAMLVVGTVGFALLALQQEALVLPGMLLAYGAGWGWPGLYQYGVAAYHREAPASATGVVQVGVLGGSAAGPTIVGLLVSSLGYRTVWLIVAGLVLVGAVVILRAARLLEHREERRAEFAADVH